MSRTEPLPPPPTLRRRNSTAASVVIPAKFTLHTSSLPPPHTNGSTTDFDLIHLHSSSSSSSYTSLKDLLPSYTAAVINSPTGAPSTYLSCFSAYEISIRNRLVKQAAWAYLQPVSSSPRPSVDHFLRRFWFQVSFRDPVSACVRFFTTRLVPSITGAFGRIIRFIRIHVHR